jgi:uncharacterized membrane protein
MWIVFTLLLAAIVHVGTIIAIPYVIGIRLRSLGESNALLHAPKPSANYNPVRRASPDMIYTAYPFDLSDGPLHISAPVPTSELYMSVSCFALNTDTIYVKNDRQVDGAFDFVLLGPDTPAPAIDDAELVRSPTTTGGIIFRYFVGDGARQGEIEAIRQQISVRPAVGSSRDER